MVNKNDFCWKRLLTYYGWNVSLVLRPVALNGDDVSRSQFRCVLWWFENYLLVCAHWGERDGHLSVGKLSQVLRQRLLRVFVPSAHMNNSIEDWQLYITHTWEDTTQGHDRQKHTCECTLQKRQSISVTTAVWSVKAPLPGWVTYAPCSFASSLAVRSLPRSNVLMSSSSWTDLRPLLIHRDSLWSRRASADTHTHTYMGSVHQYAEAIGQRPLNDQMSCRIIWFPGDSILCEQNNNLPALAEDPSSRSVDRHSSPTDEPVNIILFRHSNVVTSGSKNCFYLFL